MDANRSESAENGNSYPLNSSNVDPTSATWRTEEHGSLMLYVSVLIAVFCVGTVGNILIIGALFTHSKLRSLGNVFIGNLALSDLCVSTFVGPLAVTGVLRRDVFITNKALCALFPALAFITCGVSYLSIAAISLNRYTAICHHVAYPRIYNKKTVACFIALLWILPLTIVIPSNIGYGLGKPEFYPDASLCVYSRYDDTANFGFTVYFIIVTYVAPYMIICVCYLRIFNYTRRHQKRLMNYSTSQHLARNVTNIRLMKSISVILLLLTVMWMPLAIVMCFDYSSAIVFPRWYHLFATGLALGNSSVNSVVYAASNPRFREGYVMFIKRVFTRRARQNPDKDLATISSRTN